MKLRRTPSPTQLGFTRVGRFKSVEVGYIRLRWGEGWSEGLRSLVRAEALTRFAAQIDLSPPGRGEPTSRQVESIKITYCSGRSRKLCSAVVMLSLILQLNTRAYLLRIRIRIALLHRIISPVRTFTAKPLSDYIPLGGFVYFAIEGAGKNIMLSGLDAACRAARKRLKTCELAAASKLPPTSTRSPRMPSPTRAQEKR